MKCPTCGTTPTLPDESFCRICGTDLRAVPPAQPTQPMPPVPVADTPQPPQPFAPPQPVQPYAYVHPHQESPKKTSRVALWVVLGVLATLLLCGGVALGGFVLYARRTATPAFTSPARRTPVRPAERPAPDSAPPTAAPRGASPADAPVSAPKSLDEKTAIHVVGTFLDDMKRDRVKEARARVAQSFVDKVGGESYFTPARGTFLGFEVTGADTSGDGFWVHVDESWNSGPEKTSYLVKPVGAKSLIVDVVYAEM